MTEEIAALPYATRPIRVGDRFRFLKGGPVFHCVGLAPDGMLRCLPEIAQEINYTDRHGVARRLTVHPGALRVEPGAVPVEFLDEEMG